MIIISFAESLVLFVYNTRDLFSLKTTQIVALKKDLFPVIGQLNIQQMRKFPVKRNLFQPVVDVGLVTNLVGLLRQRCRALPEVARHTDFDMKSRLRKGSSPSLRSEVWQAMSVLHVQFSNLLERLILEFKSGLPAEARLPQFPLKENRDRRSPRSLREGESGRQDSNLRLPRPERGALPGCATPRIFYRQK